MTRNHRRIAIALTGAALWLVSSSSPAHVSLAGPGFAGTNQVLRFTVGHGCEGADTFRVEVNIPPEVTSVRGLPNVFGEADVRKDAAGAVTSVAWTKSAVRQADDQYYEVALRIGVPDAPFTTLFFPTTQTCRTPDGVESVVEWKALPAEVAAAKEGEEPPPAPSLSILPPRSPGWNRYAPKNAMTDLAVFGDAVIVWVGDAAYSSNAATMELIRSEPGVTELTEIPADAELWVKY